MRRRKKESSHLKYYIVISLIIHLGILYFLPYGLNVIATKGFMESEGKLYFVEFVQLETEVSKVQKSSKQPGDDEKILVSEEKKDIEEKKIEEKPPVKEPEPEEKDQGILETVEPEPKQEPELASKPASERKSTPEPVSEPESTSELESIPESVSEPELTEPEIEPESEQVSEPQSEPASETDTNVYQTNSGSDIAAEQVVTSENSDEIIEIPGAKQSKSENKPEEKVEEKIEPEEMKPVPESVENSKLSTSNDAAGAEPAQESEEEKKPALPSHPNATIARSIKPVYPKNAANEGVEGTVDLLVRIKADGTVQDVQITKSSNDVRLDNVALNTIKSGWRFKPYPYSYTIEITIEYKDGDTRVILGELKFLE
ncbi:hypothetical protein BBF96_04005 [Anoxybacter fermentans]|uniref:TonB C-terminal domain-containing protein n=1 Tax=Anoxybacter fermentans TaxID=1323375 RepID=A0A3S9SWC6_9FIRM|nr:energy transducer TonB [Anoxybacter fermentans]AZR72623.1 hypothetical protein BBF96_04005 [Anoxybacter fermentans]